MKRISAIAMDFDGTIRSPGGAVATDLLTQLGALRRTGIKLILATGRALPDLRLLVDVELFDALVVENGAALVIDGLWRSLAPGWWRPVRERLLRSFKTAAHEQVIISLRRERECEARAAIVDIDHDEGGQYLVSIEFNKESMMLVPKGVNKGSGLEAAIGALGVDARGMLAMGDGENDLSMFRVAGLRVAVRNAVPELSLEADYITLEEDGKGVSEAIERFCGPSTE
jgi:phosphoglycolate phosphatase (TIGR01487 family)